MGCENGPLPLTLALASNTAYCATAHTRDWRVALVLYAMAVNMPAFAIFVLMLKLQYTELHIYSETNVFSFLRTPTPWHCPHSHAAATKCRPCSNRHLMPAGPTAGLLLLAHVRTDGRTPYRYTDPAPHTMRAPDSANKQRCYTFWGPKFWFLSSVWSRLSEQSYRDELRCKM